jgi:hypothetical protein
MVPPNKSGSFDIDLFRFDQPGAESSDLLSPPFGPLDTPACRRRYHSTQLAIITGLFACGGLICSFLLIDGDEDFPRPHHWLRQSYSSPAITLPQGPAAAPFTPQKSPLRSNNEDKAALPSHWIGTRKAVSRPGRIARKGVDFRPLVALRTKWTSFTETLRRHVMPSNFLRDLAFGPGSKSGQRRLEEG